MEWRSARWPCLATENKCVMFSLCHRLIPNTLALSLPSPPIQSGLSSLFIIFSSVHPPLLPPSHLQATEFDPGEPPYHFTSLTAHDARALWPARLNHGLLLRPLINIQPGTQSLADPLPVRASLPLSCLCKVCTQLPPLPPNPLALSLPYANKVMFLQGFRF